MRMIFPKKADVWILLAVTIGIWSGCAFTTDTEKIPVADTPIKALENPGCAEWVRNRIPNGTVFGRGNAAILILAGIGGGEPAAIALARELKTSLENRPIPDREVILVIHDEEEGIRRTFSPETDHPRSKAILRLIERCRPERIISLRQLYLEGFDPDGPKEADRIARRMSDFTYPEAAVSDLPTSPGSLGNFGEVKGIPVITLAISSRSAGASGESLWQRFGYPLVAGIRYPDMPDDISISDRIQLGLDYLNAGDSEKAIRTFKALQVRDPSRVEATEYLFQAHRMAAEQAHQFENLRAARHHIREALRIRPNCEVCKDLSRRIAKAEQTIEEEPVGKDIEKSDQEPTEKPLAEDPPPSGEKTEDVPPPPKPNPVDPERADALLTEAKARFETGEYTQAQALLKSALDADPDCETCREYLNRARELNAAFQAGRDHLKASAYKLAIIQFTWIRDYNPGDANLIPLLAAAHSGFGNQLFARGDYEKAGEQFEKALAVDEACQPCMTRFDESLEADMWVKNGMFLLEKGDYEQAIPKFSNVLRLNPEDPSAKRNLAAAHRAWGENLCGAEDWIEGISHFQSAMSVDPSCGGCETKLKNCIQAFNTQQYLKAKEHIIDQGFRQALDDLTIIPPDLRDKDVLGLIDRLKLLLKE